MSIITENWNTIEEKIIKPIYEDGYFPLTLADEVTRALQQPTASEFLRKAKAICRSMEGCSNCPIRRECKRSLEAIDESGLVRKVMNYRLEDKDDRN